MQTSNKTKLTVNVGIFSAIAFLLQFLGSIMGLKVGGFLEIEFSDIPPLILSFHYGPLFGVLCELIKNLLHCSMSSTGLVGELANFVINGIMCFTAGIIYKNMRTFGGAVLSLSVATLVMVIAGIFTNLFLMLPLYMPNAEFSQQLHLVLYTIFPFNIFKGIGISVITVLLYKRISKAIK